MNSYEAICSEVRFCDRWHLHVSSWIVPSSSFPLCSITLLLDWFRSLSVSNYGTSINNGYLEATWFE